MIVFREFKGSFICISSMPSTWATSNTPRRWLSGRMYFTSSGHTSLSYNTIVSTSSSSLMLPVNLNKKVNKGDNRINFQEGGTLGFSLKQLNPPLWRQMVRIHFKMLQWEPDRRILVFCLILEVNICSLARRLTCVTSQPTDDSPCEQHPQLHLYEYLNWLDSSTTSWLILDFTYTLWFNV